MNPVVKREDVRNPGLENRGYYRLRYYCPQCHSDLFHETYDEHRCFGAGSILYEVRPPHFCPDCGCEIDWTGLLAYHYKIKQMIIEKIGGNMKKSKKHDKVVKEAYNLLVCYRRLMDDQDPRLAKRIEETYKELWCECINEPAPWC